MGSFTKHTMNALGSVKTTSGLLLLAALLSSGCQAPRSHDAAGGGVFDEQTSGSALVKSAQDQARVENKKIILLFGANWCPYCRQLHALLANDPEVSALVRKSFVVVPLDVGTSARNRNAALIDRYGATVFSDGVPSVVVIDERGNKLAPTKDNPWSAKNRIEAGRVIQFLKQAGG